MHSIQDTVYEAVGIYMQLYTRQPFSISHCKLCIHTISWWSLTEWFLW